MISGVRLEVEAEVRGRLRQMSGGGEDDTGGTGLSSVDDVAGMAGGDPVNCELELAGAGIGGRSCGSHCGLLSLVAVAVKDAVNAGDAVKEDSLDGISARVDTSYVVQGNLDKAADVLNNALTEKTLSLLEMLGVL